MHFNQEKEEALSKNTEIHRPERKRWRGTGWRGHPKEKNIRRKGEKSMKKRLATLAIVGAMAVSAVAPMTVFASTSETEVKYVTGAVTPGGGDAGYYVTIPTDIVFQNTTDTVDQTLELKAADDVKGLPFGLTVNVTVESAQGAVVNNATYGSLNTRWIVPQMVEKH